MTVSGSLSKTDCYGNLFYVDFLRLNLPPEQQSLHITMSSDSFDTWVELYRLTGEYLAFDGDVGAGATATSQLDVILAPGGTFLIAPSSWDTSMTGPYALSAIPRSASLTGCKVVWVTRGVTVSDAITPGDCVDSTGVAPRYYDIAAIYASAGSVLRIGERSAVFNAKLRLLNRGGAQVAENDDSSAGNPNAYVEYVVPSGGGGAFLMRIETTAEGATGDYVLTVASEPLPSQAAPVQPMPMRSRPPEGRHH
jgi:hypothetical protein